MFPKKAAILTILFFNISEAMKMLWILVFTLFAVPSMGEVFTSMTDMSRLLVTEGEMIRAVENYIVAQEEKLMKLKR